VDGYCGSSSIFALPVTVEKIKEKIDFKKKTKRTGQLRAVSLFTRVRFQMLRQIHLPRTRGGKTRSSKGKEEKKGNNRVDTLPRIPDRDIGERKGSDCNNSLRPSVGV